MSNPLGSIVTARQVMDKLHHEVQGLQLQICGAVSANRHKSYQAMATTVSKRVTELTILATLLDEAIFEYNQLENFERAARFTATGTKK